MDELRCPAPLGVPPDLAAPGRDYRRGVGRAFVALATFVSLYVGLTAWFFWSAWRLWVAILAGGRQEGVAILGAVPMTLLAVFMLKALFFRERNQTVRQVAIDATTEPRLFAFLHRIADEAAAPRPHRVFLSTRVNAGVFYDLSILNLIVPSRKNLDIGLGLINVLTLGEVRAVLAHEFGHFAQRAMAVGRWVHIAQRVAARMVHRRDWLDSFLRSLSGVDLRIAWVGWIMRVVVWSLRAVLDTAFVLVVRAENSLSHEMERQADLVAVSLTGSDALVNALHKLGAADAAWDHTLSIAARRHAKGEDVSDLFALQTRVLEHGRRVLADETHGVAPPLPAEGRAEHRVFVRRIAHPPRMWSSHPPNREREDNMKRTYVPCDLDDRSAWMLFADPEATRARLTETLLATLPTPTEKPRRLAPDESVRAVDESFAPAYFDPRFRGAYLGRSSVRGATTIDALYLPPEQASELSIDGLYPEDLRAALERWKSLTLEAQALEDLQRGVLQSGGAAEIQFRGQLLRKQDLARVLEAVRAEVAVARKALEARDREHRSSHLAAAERVGQGWPEYLRSLGSLLHYADHTDADLRDARGYLANTFAMVTAGGRVTTVARARLAAAGMDVYLAMNGAWESRHDVRLPADVAKALGVARWAAALPDSFGLREPTPDNIAEWMKVIDGWLVAFISPFDALERHVLEALLKAEDQVAAFSRHLSTATAAPAPAAAPETYATLVPGTERERQWRLGWWERFQTADGFGPSVARFAVSGALVAAMVFLGMSIGKSDLTVYNGLARKVIVHIDDQQRTLSPYGETTFNDLGRPRIHVVAETTKGDVIETFDERVGHFERLVYNVAGGAPLVRWVATYGTAESRPPNELGAVRWHSTDASVLFEEPPSSLSTSGGRGGTRSILSGLGNAPPEYALSRVPGAAERLALIHTRATWDEGDHPYTENWLRLAMDLPDFDAIVKARLARSPQDVLTLRAEQDRPGAKAEACARQERLAAAEPGDADLSYLALRCQPESPARDDAFVAAFAAKPSHPWLAMAAGYVYAERADWRRALDAWEIAREGGSRSARLSLDNARVMRAVGADMDTSIEKLAETMPTLRNMLALETGKGVPSLPVLAYSKLAHGDLAGAVLAAHEDAEVRPRILRFVAASRGATPRQLADALDLPPDAGLDPHTIWPALGLAVREKRDTSGFIARLDKMTSPEERPLILEFLHPERLLVPRPARSDHKVLAAGIEF